MSGGAQCRNPRTPSVVEREAAAAGNRSGEPPFGGAGRPHHARCASHVPRCPWGGRRRLDVGRSPAHTHAGSPATSGCVAVCEGQWRRPRPRADLPPTRRLSRGNATRRVDACAAGPRSFRRASPRRVQVRRPWPAVWSVGHDTPLLDADEGHARSHSFTGLAGTPPYRKARHV